MVRNGNKSHAFASKAKPKARKPTVAKNKNEMDRPTAELDAVKLDASLNTTTFHGWTRFPDEVSIRKAIQGGVFLESPPK
jgi:hypothetical protein